MKYFSFVSAVAITLFALPVLAQSLPSGASEAQVKAALSDISELYGSPVVRTDQAKAICNQEQYFLECAKIGKKHGLFSKERAEEVDALLEEFKGDVVTKLKQCSSVECLVEVATSISRQIASDNPTLAKSVDLTPQKVEEKRTIVNVAKEIGVDIEACMTMDPDTAEIELLRSCAKLAKHDKIQQYIPKEDREKVVKSENTLALKEALSRREFACGDGTIEGCGAFCLNPATDLREAGVPAIPPVCREIAIRFFGEEGLHDLERAYGNVQDTYDATRDRLTEDTNGTTNEPVHLPKVVCPVNVAPDCPDGEYRQGHTNEFGCFVEGKCIPLNTLTVPPQKDKQITCPSMPTVQSCGDDEERIIAFSSPECGSYYMCKTAIKDRSGRYPYTFKSGRVVLAFEETRIYCYESGSQGASSRGDKFECQNVFGIKVPDVPPEKKVGSCERFEGTWKSVDESGNCFSADMSEYLTANGVLKSCADYPVYGCNGTRTYKPPEGQKEQIWNAYGIMSWIRADADSARVASLKAACANVRTQANIWTSGAGNSSSQDFGMPDPEKCRKATQCPSSEYFDGISCVQNQNWNYSTSSAQQGCASAGGAWDSSNNYCKMPNASSTDSWHGSVTGSCSSELLKLLGTGCHSMGNAWFNDGSTMYVFPGGSSIHSCSTEFIGGCAGKSPYTSGSAEAGCKSAGGTWDSAANYCKMPNGSQGGCPSGQYWNGSACTTNTSSGASTASMQAGCKSAGGTWDTTANYCKMPTDASCPSGQYWNGSTCMTPSSSGTSASSMQDGCKSAGGTWDSTAGYCRMPSSSQSGGCAFGQYWNGSSCVSSGSSSSGSSGTYDTSSMTQGCASAGGTWDSAANYCKMPNSGSYPSGSSGSYNSDSAKQGCASAGGTWDSGGNYCKMPGSSSIGSKPLAFLCPEGYGYLWNGGYCVRPAGAKTQSYVGSVFSALTGLLGF